MLSSTLSRMFLAGLTAALTLPAAPALAVDDRTAAAYGDASVSTAKVVVPMVFPVIGPVSYSDTYLACRSGCARRHFGQDLMGPKMNVAVAAFNGVVWNVKRESYVGEGNYLTLKGDNGWSANYIHMNNDSPGTDDGRGTAKYFLAPGVTDGKRVFAGEILGWVGDSGNAESTAPHLHFELRKGDPWSGTVYNAFASLNSARRLSKPTTSGPHLQGTAIKACATCTPWLLDGGLRRQLLPEVAKQYYFDARTVVPVTQNEATFYKAGPKVPLPDGRGYQGPDGTLWYVSHGVRWLMADLDALKAVGVAAWRVRAMTDAGLATVPVAPEWMPVPEGVFNEGALLRVPGSTTSWWWMVDGERRLIANAETLKSWGLVASDSIPLPAPVVETDPETGEELLVPVELPPLGAPLPIKDGAFLKDGAGRYWVVANGMKRRFTTWKAAVQYGYGTVLYKVPSAAVLWRLPTGPTYA